MYLYSLLIQIYIVLYSYFNLIQPGDPSTSSLLLFVYNCTVFPWTIIYAVLMAILAVSNIFLQIILHLLMLYIYLLHMYRYISKTNSQMRNYEGKMYDTWYMFMHVANSASLVLCQSSFPPEMCESGLYNTISYRGHCQKFWSFIFQCIKYNSM